MVSAAPGAGAGEREPSPLPWRTGGKLGFTVDAAAFPEPEGEVLEVYLRLPSSTISRLGRAESGEPKVRVSVELRNRFGAFHHEARQEFAVSPSDTGGFGKVVMLKFPVKSGEYHMEVGLEDLQSRRRGIAYIGRSVAQAATVEGDLTVPEAAGGMRVSDLEFAWDATSRAPGFQRAGSEHALLPNPERLYGLLAAQVRAQFVAQGDDSSRGWRWRARVLDGQGQVVAERESTMAAGSRWVQDVAMDISTEPAGGYDLELRTWREGDLAPVVRRGRFSIAWQPTSWWRSPREIEDDVHFLLDREEDEEAFARMSPGEQEAYLDTFWRERDPTPSTAGNEARVEFYRRVEHANQTWRSSLGKGMFTDMGRAYIRHGEPDEILRQVLPAGDQTLAHLLQQIDATEDRPTGDVESKGLGGDIRPFEVWIYEAERVRSITAKPDDPGAGLTRKRLMFLFVDEQGYGDYRLRYTTE